MNDNTINKKNIFGIQIANVDYGDLVSEVIKALEGKKQITLTGVNVSTINLVFSLDDFLEILNDFDILHPDGIGIYFYSHLGNKKRKLKQRITGSDFYMVLLKEILLKKWKIYFFGDEDHTLFKIQNSNPNLVIAGLQNGFNFKTNDLISKINESKADILVVGMGAPKQERWIFENRGRLNVNVIIAVGDGIKMFSGTKVRGYKIVQFFGLEWLIRLINNPKLYWKRYILGIPLFFLRTIKYRNIYKNE